MKKIVLYIDVDEEVTSIFDRVKHFKNKSIFLVIPKKSIVFQSVVNLKILKKKMDERNIEVILVTTDRIGKHLAEQADIIVRSRVEVKKIEVLDEEEKHSRITPIQARRNAMSREEVPKRSTQRKLTIGELVKEFRDKKDKAKDHLNDSFSALPFQKSQNKFLLIIFLLTIGLFFLITYIALPSSTIYIRPTFEHIDHSVNVTLANKRQNQTLLRQGKPHVIASEDITTVIKQTKVFNVTSHEFQGVNAKGKIRIINTTYDSWPLKAQTRFRTDEGIVFRLQTGAIVPPASKNEAGVKEDGEIITIVVADPFDIYEHPVGERGNLGPTKFIIPGLSKYNQELIWAVSDGVMKGGVTQYQKIVKDEDIEVAQKQIQENLVMMAKEDLKMHIKELNKMGNSNLVLLDDRQYLKTELLEFKVADDLIGQQREKFEVFAKIKASGIAYDFDQLFVLLKDELSKRTHPNMQLKDDSISPQNVTYEVIENDEENAQIKITATVQGLQEFIIDDHVEAGIKFNQRIKNKVQGLTKEEAERLLSNFEEVDAVEIRLWPIWINTLPRVPENIDIKLMK